MNALLTFLYIILFLLCLSVLIIVHELGHLTAAKVFKVYCLEFSCGMGPLIFKHKRKGGETQLSLRAIPFGGYVSMYGEGVTLPDGVKVDESRSLTSIKKWKRAIILVAGVTMNAILALVIFFINNVAFEQHKFIYSNEISVVEGSKAETAGLKAEDILAFDESFESKSSILLPNFGTITYNDNSTKEVGVALTPVASFVSPVYSYTFYAVENNKIISTNVITLTGDMKNISLDYTTKANDVLTSHIVNLDIVDGLLEDSGLRIFVSNFRYSFGEALGQTFVDFGTSSTAIVDSLGGLITGQVGVNELSGVVGIGFEARNILESLGVNMFIYLWGLISVNLAIVNLLPFPGLDGWQLLVLIIEGITKKKIPESVANIVSFIGIALLFVFMIVILFKDIWVYILKGLIGGLLSL